MIKKNHIAKVIISVISALFLWTLTCINVSLYSVYTTQVVFRYGAFITALIFSFIVAVLGSVKVDLNNRYKKIAGVISFIAAVFGAMQISVIFSDGFSSGIGVYFINILFYLGFAMVGSLISGSLSVGGITALSVSYIFNAISLVIYSFRGSSLTPTDLCAINTAKNVASNYEFNLKYQMITATAVTVVLIMTVCKFPLKLCFKRAKIIVRSASAAVLAAIVSFMATTDFSDYDISVYDQYYANLMYGSAFSFYVNSTKMGLAKDENYNPHEIEKKLLSYDGTGDNPDFKPNIIAIMNESFSDLSVIGDFEASEDSLSYFKSLEDNTIRGNLLVSPFGGYTCNTEYEFLTGMPTGVLKSRSAPYIQMMFNDLPYSLNTHLKSLGYTATALHPYYASGWNRPKVYDYMSFDKFVSLENLTDYTEYPEYCRGYISDKSSYDAILNMMYEKKPDERKFIFNVTMQNHGSYDDDSFESDVSLDNMNGSYPEAEQYLSLLKRSDEAFNYLLNNLKAFDEPTIVLMFGDHMPNVEREFYEELYGTSLDNLEGEQPQKRYIVPFVIWANYDIEEKTDIYTSPCYLSNILMDTAGLPKSRVQLYLEDLSTELSQINPMGYYDPDGYWHNFNETHLDEDYYNLQYAILTGENLTYDFSYTVKELPAITNTVHDNVLSHYNKITIADSKDG